MSRKQLRPSRMLAFDIDAEPLEECLTARAGLPIVAEAYRALGAEAAVSAGVKESPKARVASRFEWPMSRG